jgi:hypothetical protein
MEMKKCVGLIAMGVGGTLLYQQIMNGNAKRMIKDMKKNMKRITLDACDDLEDMM